MLSPPDDATPAEALAFAAARHVEDRGEVVRNFGSGQTRPTAAYRGELRAALEDWRTRLECHVEDL